MLLENEVKSLITQKNIISSVVNDSDRITVVNEVKIENGITIDHVVYNRYNKAIALIESKGGDIGITEFLRGIGQVTQYQSHIDNRSVLNYSKDCVSILAFPNTLYSKIDSIESLAFPKKTLLLVINEINGAATIIKPKRVRGSESFKDVVRISPYYIRDNRIGELYVGLLELKKRFYTNSGKINRNMDSLFQEIGAPNPGNARNVAISLSSLGLIDSKNNLTSVGHKYSLLNYVDFSSSLINEFLSPYVNIILYSLLKFFQPNSKGNYELSWVDLKQVIDGLWGKEIEFLTESRTRYISSWCNILKNDINCINFESNKQKKEIQINFLPMVGTFDTEIKNIKTPDYVEKYLSTYFEL